MINTQAIIAKHWIIFWICLNILAPLFSFIGGYGFLYVFALFYPLAQTIAIRKIENVKYPWIWMTHFIYWTLILSFIHEEKLAITSILMSTILGQFLLKIMFGTFGNLNWIIWNTAGIGLLILIHLLLRYYQIQISNDFFEIIIIVGSFTTSSCLSGIGIKQGYIKDNYNSK
jgi:hypothetical protein